MEGGSNNFGYVGSNVENKGFFSRILRNVSNFGMDYDKMLIKNQVGIGINEDPYAARDNNSMYDFFSRRAVSAVLNKKSIPYLDRAYPDKRRILREYSIKDEIRDFITSIADECIIYNDERDFCAPSQLPNTYPTEVVNKYQEVFESVYNKYGFSDTITAWNMMKDYLIDGHVAVEMVYDDKNKNVIHYNRLKPETLVPAYEPSIGNLWIQYPEDPQLRRVFLDSQIIFVSYTTQDDYSETSYVEGLIKPYNQLKIIEQTRIMFNIINATIYQKFTIPIKGLGKTKAEEQIGQLIQDYSEEVEWDDSLGTLKINGTKHLPYNKQIWFPEGEGGTPNMELVSPEGHDLNDETMLSWFYKALKRASKIPLNRFEGENGGGNLVTDASEMTRDEIKFYNFINRIRANFKELIVKPIRIQMLLEFPELKNDDTFLNSIDIAFNTNQVFEEWKKINNLAKKSEIVSTLLGVMNGDKPYFHIEYLMDNIFKLSAEDKAENERYWLLDKTGNAENAEGGEGTDTSSPDVAEGDIGGAQESTEPESGGDETPPEGGGEETEFEF